MPNVVITIDCEAAHHSRCYSNELIDLLEQEFVPATWMIHCAPKEPTAEINLYWHEYFHRIPNWHEIGMKLSFETDRGVISDEKERGNLIRIGRDALKSHQIKATSFRASGYGLLSSDVKYLEDVGIVVDSSIAPDASYKVFADWTDAPKMPYHGSANDLKIPGKNRLLHVPLSTHAGEVAYLDKGFDAVKAIFSANKDSEVVCFAVRDYEDQVEELGKSIRYFRELGAHFTTLTQAASEHYEHHEAKVSV